MASALAAVDPGLPWHLRAFVSRYRMRDGAGMDPPALVPVAGSAHPHGLRHVCVGNARTACATK